MHAGQQSRPEPPQDREESLLRSPGRAGLPVEQMDQLTSQGMKSAIMSIGQNSDVGRESPRSKDQSRGSGGVFPLNNSRIGQHVARGGESRKLRQRCSDFKTLDYRCHGHGAAILGPRTKVISAMDQGPSGPKFQVRGAVIPSPSDIARRSKTPERLKPKQAACTANRTTCRIKSSADCSRSAGVGASTRGPHEAAE